MFAFSRYGETYNSRIIGFVNVKRLLRESTTSCNSLFCCTQM